MKNGFQKFISGKGFYLALAVCLAGAGAAAWVAVDKTIESIEQPPLAKTPQTKQEQGFFEPAEKRDSKPAEAVKQQEPAPTDSSNRLSADSSGSGDGRGSLERILNGCLVSVCTARILQSGARILRSIRTAQRGCALCRLCFELAGQRGRYQPL